MNTLLLLAVIGSAVAAPQQPFHRNFQGQNFAPVRTFDDSSFAPPPTGFAAPVTGFAAPVRSFAPVAPVRSFAHQPTGFAQQPTAFGGVRTATPSRTINFDTSAPVTSFHTQPAITVVERKEYLNDNGEFSSSATGSDGQTFQEVGKLRPTNDGLDQVIVKEGGYSYTSPEGIPISVTYTADEYGFHPISNAIPVPVAPLQPTF